MTSQELKNSILQYAVQGKLVPQNPNDEPASELLKRIKAEKEQLLLEKKIRKERPAQTITDDEKPFEIPDSWEWVRLSEIGVYKKGPFGSSLTKSMFVPRGINSIKVYEQKNAIYKNHLLGDYYIKKEYFETKMKGFEVFPNDILVSCAGTIGETYIVPEDAEQGIINQALMIMKITNEIQYKYFLLYFDYVLKKTAQTSSNGSAIKNIPPFEVFKNLLFPLPPLAEQQRIVEKIEDLMPLVEEYGKAEAELKELNKAFPEKIKKSVLQYAIQGKLVPQNPQNEQASVLLEKIKAEKQKLIREKKIKADKPLPAITEEEIPFEIPDNWVWVRLGELGIIQTGTTPSTQNPDYFGNEIPFIKPADISFSGINYYNEGLTLLGSKKSRVVEKNSVLMVCIGGSIGKNYFNDRDVCCNQQINAITPLLASNKYLFYALCSEYFYQSLLSKATGTATPIINKSTWSELIIPLPPLSEQKLIVEKVEEVLSYCDKLK